MPFAPVRKQQISDLVFEQLRESIYRGELKIGERLPSERELAEIMRVSRSSIRKAISRLLDMGYVENRAGLGTFVRLPEARPPHDPFAYMMSPGQSSLDELMEVRIGLECQGVALAAERATEMDITYLELAFAEMHDWQPDQEKAKDADMRFHMGIAYATHNAVHVDLTRRFYDYMFHSINKLHSLLYEKNKNLGIIDQQHFKILDAIKCRDGESASRYMLQHITFLRGFLKEISTNN
ncbi:FadR/GntR family transcriptional regulator [Desulfopila aestuarii]|uniref:Transcriptional regulator, GntR family n=1 Tax=Desulfopila aestuarii DSM 18488 TaxID=1121416 RepID=A0A1M7Y382_9BACT|nr:FadR/GntR family transcriptional regulator [Desulfopila aestuarii]SHO46354.1 transcriptional regulator, GntR family [Desulfopila aestuarii DSM 18488]